MRYAESMHLRLLPDLPFCLTVHYYRTFAEMYKAEMPTGRAIQIVEKSLYISEASSSLGSCAIHSSIIFINSSTSGLSDGSTSKNLLPISRSGSEGFNLSFAAG